MLTPIILIFHIVVSLSLIFLVLLHAGRGGGLSDMFGGGSLGRIDGRIHDRRAEPGPDHGDTSRSSSPSPRCCSGSGSADRTGFVA